VIPHIETKLLLQPGTDTLIALKAFGVVELLLQLRQRFSRNSRFLATMTPMADDEQLKIVLLILFQQPALNGFSLN
jgi:hypothetical protein